MNLSTKEDIINKLIKSYKRCQKESNNDEILIGRVVEKAGIKQTDKNQIFDLFGVDKYEDIFKQIPKATIINNGNRNKLVKICELEKSEEKQMENTNTKNHDRIEKLLTILKQGLYEKDEAIRLALLTAISGESIFFLGAPGCAKSMIARRIVQAFKSDEKESLKYFEYLMNQFSTPEDIFGNISLTALIGEGESGKEEYKRITDRFLPQADIAFLDEIWKASPAIQNTLLTIINERKFHNGGKVEDVPLKALFAASNELPTKNEGLEALYDRFILRLVVDFIQNEDSFFEMIDDSNSTDSINFDNDKNLLISNEDLENWRKQIDKVKLSDAARAVISAIRKELTLQNESLSDENKKNGELFVVGDRRWKKIAHILKTSAFLNDRNEVDLMDCSLIENCIWGTEKQQKKAKEIVEKCIKQNGLDCDTAIDDIQEQIGKYHKDICKTFYEDEYKIIKGEPIIEKIDGEDCYQVTINDGDKYYVGNSYYYTSKTGSNRERCNSNSRRINGNSLTWERYYDNRTFSATINHSPNTKHKTGKLVKNSLFQNQNALEPTKKSFDEKYYTPIKSFIEKEIKKLDDFASEKTAPYKANLFANQEYCDVIMNAVTEAKKALQDTQVELDKERNYYQ
jgi:MoxR-like ATPase